MGDVYRARDTTLNRDVAIKVLPDLFASDADRLARFIREAQTLASLNHPNIAHIHGLEESNGLRALVMELVEGEDLSQRMARGPISIDEALPIAKQIAEALEAAHEQGIIHRDLKPANIKVRVDGTVKVLDFGLAKAMEPVGRAPNVSQSPTITTPAMTQAGIILGTPAYMSPEQARGKTVDRRVDIWAFGVVLYEMLTGQRLFTGETISDTLASVLKTDPNWSALPAEVPLRLRRLLRECLNKDPKRRLQAMGDARVQIEDDLAGTPEEAVAAVLTGTVPLWRRVLPWASTGALALALMLVLLSPWRNATPASAPLRLSAELGADVTLAVISGDAMSLSPDGAVLAFVGQKGAAGRPQLFVRRLTQLQALPLSGTDDAESPFFSPDGQWIGFFAGGRLKKISVTGGATVTLCNAPNGRGGTWSEDHRTIVFSPNNTPGTRLMRVSSDGGTPEQLIPEREAPQADLMESLERWPQLLPGGKAVLFTRGRNVGANVVVQPLPTGARTVVHAGSRGRYLPSGHLVYLQDATLFAVPFDLDRLAVTGPSVPAIEGVMSNASTGFAQLAVSASGTLVYLPGQNIGIGTPILWMDHEGKTTPLRVTPATWINILFAPDGQNLALQIDEGMPDIWVLEWAQDRLTRLTSDPAADIKPVWSPDGRRIVFASDRATPSTVNLYWQRTDGTGAAQRLTESKNPQEPASWHPSGTFLAFTELNPTTNRDLMILPMEGDEASGWKPGTPTVFLNTAAQEREPMFSSDGRWLAYTSNEAGHDEVYVRPFRGPGGRQLVSTGGGVMPTWSRKKRELLYVINGQIMVVPYAVEGNSFRAEAPRRWSDGPSLVSGSGAVRMFDLHPDGERIAFRPLRQTPVGAAPDHFTMITNFFDELRRVAIQK
jgi:Tol biopolymer transport system component